MILTERQRRFVAAYTGDVQAAALAAGYSATTARAMGKRIMEAPGVKAALEARRAKEQGGLIATREERQRFWTEVMRDESRDARDRLKASELLGKSEADFTEKVEHSGALTLEQLVLASRSKDTL